MFVRRSNGEDEEVSTSNTHSTRKKSAKGKKMTQDIVPSTPQAISRRTKKISQKSDESTKQDESNKRTAYKPAARKSNKESKTQSREPVAPLVDRSVDMDDEDEPDDGGDGGGGDLFSRSNFLGRGGHASLSQARALLGGLMPHPGTAAKLRGLLQNIRSHDDPGMQVLAMEELAELLLVSNEDNLNGQFVPDQFVKELVLIMRGGEFGTSSLEMMELACRCIANLLEALPQATHSVVTGGAIPVLCEKLTNMEYMEQAEQAMTTLSKISDEFPGAIVREGGLLACLMHLDFFTTYMQKTAVSTAAKCCYDLSDSSFDSVLEVMSTLQNVLNNSEQEVVKQAALCITRIVNRFGYHERLEELVKPELLQIVFRLLLPASTNIVGDDVQTRFLGLLSTVAQASPKLTAELLKNDVVDIIYQFLTGVSPPEGNDDLGSKIDGVIVMQALIHKPRDQIFAALNLIGLILPETFEQESSLNLPPLANRRPGDMSGRTNKKRIALNAERLAVFESCKDKVRRFVMILLPTLTHAYDITVNLNVRSTVLDAQLKMLSNIDSDILEAALRTVPFASFLASILSQEDHNNLVLQALEATELLLNRMKRIYAHQFCREGVLAELKRLAEQKLSEKQKQKPESRAAMPLRVSAVNNQQIDGPGDDPDEMAEDEIHHLDEADIEAEREFVDEFSGSATSSDEEMPAYVYSGDNTKDQIILKARRILEAYDDEQGKQIIQQAEAILVKSRSLSSELKECYQKNLYKMNPQKSRHLFNALAEYFSSDDLKSITSAELLNSEIIDALLDILDYKHGARVGHARQTFVEAFMKPQKPSEQDSATAFNILIHKLQDLLSRKEHLEVLTVHNNSQENTRMDKDNLSYQLGKQIRLKLEGSESSEIPQRYRNVIVSIHAIATFKSLNDYLRPRMLISVDDLSRSEVLSTLAALTGSDMPHRQRLIEMERALQLQRTGSSDLSNPTNPTKKSSTRSLREKAAINQAAQAVPQTPTPTAKQPIRRSSRHSKSNNLVQISPPIENSGWKIAREPLECADEHTLEEDHIDDDEGDNDDDDEELDAFVEGLDEGLGDEPITDPDPVDLEVASTGKVIARQEDGTRIVIPVQGTPSGPGSTISTGRLMSNAPVHYGNPGSRSYAAVAQSTPQDWHLEFSIDGKPIPMHSTVYRAIHFHRSDSIDTSSRSIWSSTHTIKYKKMPGPPSEPNTLASSTDTKTFIDLPDSLHKNTVTSKILRLLDFLHDINSNLGNILIDNATSHLYLHTEPAAQFVNTKLTAKLNRQLEEPLIVASLCLPQWSEDLVRLYPFLFPFEARYLYLQSNYFGYHRAIERWTHAQSDDSRRDRRRDDRPYLSIPKKQKVRIARERLFDSAVKVLDLYASANASLEVEYFDEVGTGLGPTMEFYSNVSKEFAKKKHGLWRQGESAINSEYTFSKLGLFPAPMSASQLVSEDGKKALALFRTLGKFVARSMIDSRMIDISFNPMFFRCGDPRKNTISQLAAVMLIDQDLARSLKHVQSIIQRKNKTVARRLSGQQKNQAMTKINIEVEALSLDMTLPGYPAIELVENGRNIDVTADNISEYLSHVTSFTIDRGVSAQLQAFQSGFSQVFSYNALKAFTPDELVMIFGSSDEDWSIPTLIDSIKADHGFNIDSKPVRNLLHVMSEMNDTQRRLYLQFVTGSPKLPIGGM